MLVLEAVVLRSSLGVGYALGELRFKTVFALRRERVFRMRRYSCSRDVRAGCFDCWGSDAKWTTKNAQALAARHHDATGHITWVDIGMSIRYGREPDEGKKDEPRTT